MKESRIRTTFGVTPGGCPLSSINTRTLSSHPSVEHTSVTDSSACNVYIVLVYSVRHSDKTTFGSHTSSATQHSTPSFTSACMAG